MKVLHVSPQIFAPDGRIAGGGERYPFELARHMARRVPTRLLSFGPRDLDTRVDALPVRIVGGDWSERDRAHNPFSTELIREVLQADVVHCHQQHVLASKAAAAVCRLSGKRIAVTDHGGGAWDWTGRLPTSWLFERKLHVSRFSLESSGQHGDPGASVLFVGVDVDRFIPGPAVEGPPRALFVGRLLAHKGVDDLIAGLPEGVGLDVIGAPIDERYVRDLKELATGRDVAFHHDLDDAELVAAYQCALCVVLPSRYTDRYGNESAVPELLGQTLLEGMACGRPALCTRVGGMPEVVVDGRTGFVVDEASPSALGERLAWMRDHLGETNAMGQAARRHMLAEFTWDRVVERCLEAYRA
jgi:glycosyltransferase involved in cell wall biosynthesis